MNPDPKAPKTFTTITGNDLMAQEYEPLQFSIEKILPHGIFVFAGNPKVGKSWLTLEMSSHINRRQAEGFYSDTGRRNRHLS